MEIIILVLTILNSVAVLLMAVNSRRNFDELRRDSAD